MGDIFLLSDEELLNVSGGDVVGINFVVGENQNSVIMPDGLVNAFLSGRGFVGVLNGTAQQFDGNPFPVEAYPIIG